jgi:hypothetical protein
MRVRWLRQTFGEVHAGSVVLAPGLVIEKFTNPARKTWTLLRTTAGGKSSLVQGPYRPGPLESGCDAAARAVRRVRRGGVQRVAVWRHRRHPHGARCQGSATSRASSTRPINFEVETAKRPKRSSRGSRSVGAS